MLLFCKYFEGYIFPRIKRKTKRIGNRARTDIHTGRAKGWKTFIQSGIGLGFPTLKKNFVLKLYPLFFHNFTINPPWSCLYGSVKSMSCDLCKLKNKFAHPTSEYPLNRSPTKPVKFVPFPTGLPHLQHSFGSEISYSNLWRPNNFTVWINFNYLQLITWVVWQWYQK